MISFKLIGLTVCWKNDTPSGFHITVPEVADDFRHYIEENVARHIDYLQSDRTAKDNSIARIDQFALDYNAAGRHVTAALKPVFPGIATSIIAMVRLKMIPNDEFNGTLFEYAMPPSPPAAPAGTAAAPPSNQGRHDPSPGRDP